MSIASELSQLNTNKTNIKAAIVGKNPTVSPTDNLSQWPTSIGSIVELKGETKTITPTTSQQTINPSSGKNGITQITVNPVTSSIDANIVSGNIKDGVSILGVTGSYEGSGSGLQGYTLTIVDEGGGVYDHVSIVAYHSDGTSETHYGSGTINNVSYIYAPVNSDHESCWNTGTLYSGYYYILLMQDTTVKYQSACFLKGTMITLSNGIEKPIEDITFDDELLVWNFDNGCLSKAKPIWIKKPEINDYWFLNKYKSGKVLKTTGKSETGWGHRTFDLNKNKFIYTTESVSDNIFTLDGIDTHMSCERIEEPCEYYNIITERHFNLFANRILTSCSLNNLYPIKDMKYVKDGRKLRDISDYKDIP